MSEFIGESTLIYLTLAVGAALAGGTAMALIRPKAEVAEGELDRPPLVRSLIQIAIGLFVVIWSLASLFG